MQARESNKIRLVLSRRDYEKVGLKKLVHKDVLETWIFYWKKNIDWLIGHSEECPSASCFELAQDMGKQLKIGSLNWKRKVEVEPTDIETFGKLSESILEAAQSIKDGKVKDGES